VATQPDKHPETLRARAEEWRARRQKPGAIRPEDVAAFLEELELHHIELEMQNEELREAQRNLEESRQQFRDLYDLAPVGYLTLDRHETIIQANLTVATMLGVTRDQLVGERFCRFVVGESQDAFYLARLGVDRDRGRSSSELILRKADGRRLPVSMEMTGGSPDLSTYRCVLIDIAMRHAAEQALRESEDRYRGLAEQIVDAIVVLDASGRALDANRAACEMFGYTLDEMKTLATEHVLTAEELASVPDTLRHLAGGDIVRDERRFRRKDGSVFTGEIVGRRLRDGRVQAVIRDVTERKELESVQSTLQNAARLPLDQGNIDDVLGAILETAIVIARADFGTIQLLDPESPRLHIAAHRWLPQWWLDYWETTANESGACGAAFRSGKRVIIEDVGQSPMFSGADMDVQLKAGVRAVQSTPLLTRSGKCIGVFSTHWKRPHRPDARTVMMLDLVAREAADIIHHAQSEAELKRQAALLDFAHDSIFVRDFDGLITYWNEGAVKCYGWSKEEALGATSHVLLQTQYAEPLSRILDIVTATGYWAGELVHTCRDGRCITVDSRWAILDGGNQTGRRILEINNDVTQRKQAEAALRENEQQLQSYIDQAGDAIYVIEGESGHILNANACGMKMLGYSREELLQLSAVDIECAHTPAEIAGIHERTKGGVVEVEGMHRRKDGSTFPVEVRVTALASPTSDRVLAIVRDISERKRLEREREEASRRKDEFLAFLGHELRNPLAAIHTAVRVLSGDTSPAVRASMEDTISDQTTLMRRLVDDLLELERITHGQVELKFEPLNLGPCLQRSVAAVQSTIASRRQELLLRLPPEPLSFMADGTRLDQMVINLLTNASKYTGPGGRIELSGGREGTDVIIRCKDNGQGVPPEYRQTIFEPFARGPRTELGYGEMSAGLGLALVKHLTELHGGTISVDSPGSGLGSEFIIRLPLVAPPLVRSAAGQRKSAGQSRRPRSFVIVEDNPSVGGPLKVALEQAGHSVHLFVDGPSTLAGVSDLKPDVFLIDVGLPGIDGYELAAQLKQRPQTMHALRVALSGFSPRDRRGAGGEFHHYFTKPVDVDDLLDLLDQR